MRTRWEMRYEKRLKAEWRKTRAGKREALGRVTLAQLQERYKRNHDVTVSAAVLSRRLRENGCNGHTRLGYPREQAEAIVDSLPLHRAYSRAHETLTRAQLATGEFLPLCYIAAVEKIPQHRMLDAAKRFGIAAFICGGILWANRASVCQWWAKKGGAA